MGIQVFLFSHTIYSTGVVLGAFSCLETFEALSKTDSKISQKTLYIGSVARLI